MYTTAGTSRGALDQDVDAWASTCARGAARPAGRVSVAVRWQSVAGPTSDSPAPSGLSLTVPRYMSWKAFHINALQGSTHVSRLPFFTYSCTWNFFVSSWKEVDYTCFHVSINCQSRVWRLSACNASGIGGRPDLECPRHTQANPGRRQRVNVSGFTTLRERCHSNQWESHTRGKRVALVTCRGVTLRA
jgi:hypothetical protein